MGLEKKNIGVCKVAANTAKKWLRIADKGGPPAWGFGVGLTAARRKGRVSRIE
jgi:hypothetical protein